MRDKGICPHPGKCSKSVKVSISKNIQRWACSVSNHNPVIFCSLATCPEGNIELTEASVRKYLDKQIYKWRKQWRAEKKNLTARC